MMRYVSLLLFLLSLPSFGATYQMQACPGGFDPHLAADVCGTGDSGDCCPPVLSNCFAGPLSSTTADGGCDTTVSDGTAYVCISTSATPPLTFQVNPADSTGCAGHTSATPNAGAFSFAGVSGLSASTTYYAHYGQVYDGRNNIDVGTAGIFQTPAGGGGGGTDLTGADAYFIDSASSAGGDGSLSAPWDALSDISGTSTGKDIYLKRGSTFEDATLSVGWGGTSSNSVIIGCYYLDSGNSNQPTSCHEGTDPIAVGDADMPEINGTYEAACRGDASCPVDGGGSVPGSKWNGLVDVQAAHVTVQDLAIKDSSGHGVRFAGNYDVSRVGFGAKRLYIRQTYNSGIQVNKAPANADFVILDSTLDLTALQKVDGYESNWPACLGVDSNNAAANGLIDGVRITDCGGEGIGLLRVQGIVVRNSYLADIRRPSIYIDNSSHNIIEQNTLLGDGFGSGLFLAGVQVTVEPYGGGFTFDAVENVVRNNLFANTGSALRLAVATTSNFNCNPCNNPAEDGFQVGMRAYGNTILAGSGDLLFWSDSLKVNNNLQVLELKNNLFVGSNSCTLESGTGADIVANAFSSTPSDPDCTGTSAVIGGLDISGNSTANDANQPALSAFRPGASSNAIDAGTALTAALLDDANYLFSQFRSPVPSAAEWEKKNTVDYEGTARTTPDIGALEQ